MKYNIGDRVKDWERGTGKIIGWHSHFQYLVEFDKWDRGHDGYPDENQEHLSLGNFPKRGSKNSWYYSEKNIHLLEELELNYNVF